MLASLTGCETGAGLSSPLPDGPKVIPCPALREYSNAERNQAAAELKLVPEHGMIERLLLDYVEIRDRIRAGCQ